MRANIEYERPGPPPIEALAANLSKVKAPRT